MGDALEQLTKRLADEGKLIEAGWVMLRIAAVPLYASEAQLDDMRMAFMAGAQHLFSSIMTILDPSDEEPPTDKRHMDLIARELAAFGEELDLLIAKPAGRG